jgi:hypothetical protein
MQTIRDDLWLWGGAMTAVAESDDVLLRKADIRRRELLLTLELWAPAYQNVAGDSLRYVFGIAAATEDEQSWLRQQVADNGMPQATPRSAEELRAEGQQANAAASAAFLAGDYDMARNLIDDARVYGALFEGEWTKLHHFISAKAAEKASEATA